MDGEGLGEERGTPPLTRLSPSLATMISGGRSSPSVLSSLVPVSQDDMLAHVQLEMAGLRDQLAEAVGRADTAEARIRDLERILVQQQAQEQQKVDTLMLVSQGQESELQALQQQVQSLQAELRESSAALASSSKLEGALLAAQSDLRAARQTRQDDQGRATELSKDVALQREAVEQLEARLEAERRDHEVEAQVLGAQIEALQQLVDQLQAKAEENHVDRSEMRALGAENMRLRDELDELQQQQVQHASGGGNSPLSTSPSSPSPRMRFPASPRVASLRRGNSGSGSSQTESLADSLAESLAQDLQVKYRKDKARLQWERVIGKLRSQSILASLAHQARQTAVLTQEKRGLEAQVEALGLALQQMKTFVDANQKVVRAQTPNKKSGHSRSSSTGGLLSKRGSFRRNSSGSGSGSGTPTSASASDTPSGRQARSLAASPIGGSSPSSLATVSPPQTATPPNGGTKAAKPVARQAATSVAV
eukprot:m.97511 g.97511  ORF g.97511 m.97511 type:complete len:480 (+) comp15225_c0_seq3:325-1764(+)